jgi:hypothetical protein
MTESFYKTAAVVSPLNPALTYVNEILFNSKTSALTTRARPAPKRVQYNMFRNVGSHTDYTALYPIRWQHYSYYNVS